MSDLYPIKRALISVSDKTDIIKLASALVQHGIEIISTGGSAETLRASNITVKDVSELTEFPEMMNGRVRRYIQEYMVVFLPCEMKKTISQQ